jgi:hypothetical protein
MLHIVLLAEGVCVPANLLTRSLRKLAALLRDVGLCSDLSKQSCVLESIPSSFGKWSRSLVACVGDTNLVWLLSVLVHYNYG